MTFTGVNAQVDGLSEINRFVLRHSTSYMANRYCDLAGKLIVEEIPLLSHWNGELFSGHDDKMQVGERRWLTAWIPALGILEGFILFAEIDGAFGRTDQIIRLCFEGDGQLHELGRAHSIHWNDLGL